MHSCPHFLKTYPGIQVDLFVTNLFLNLIVENIDVAIRWRTAGSSLKRDAPSRAASDGPIHVDVRRRASARTARTAARDGSRRLWLVSFDRRGERPKRLRRIVLLANLTADGMARISRAIGVRKSAP